ncbi:sarcoplasmic/endoplasmic reticulum calcium ATPase regulator DWORF-like [Salarias fasciatus]|nr:sarcoplasmic/endoplasmic reticulum calcium ATPase regulator DWORF [Salarias fasciatus]
MSSAAGSASSLLPVLLMIGWLVGCLAVLYFVFIFAWENTPYQQ